MATGFCCGRYWRLLRSISDETRFCCGSIERGSNWLFSADIGRINMLPNPIWKSQLGRRERRPPGRSEQAQLAFSDRAWCSIPVIDHRMCLLPCLARTLVLMSHFYSDFLFLAGGFSILTWLVQTSESSAVNTVLPAEVSGRWYFAESVVTLPISLFFRANCSFFTFAPTIF